MPDAGEVRYKARVDTSNVSSDVKKAEEAIEKSAQKGAKATESASQQAEKSVGAAADGAAKKVDQSADKAADAIKSPTTAADDLKDAIDDISAAKIDDVGDAAESARPDVDKLKTSAKEADAAVDKLGDASEKSGSKIKSGLGAAAKVAGAAILAIGAAAASGVVALGKAGVEFNAQMENYQTSFEVMTGSAEEAARITEQLKDTAAATPFSMTDLADTTQLLMNYGLTADEAMSRMEMLGDISQGSADKMNRIATAYGQMSSLGKVQLEDVKQMIEAGFNPLQEISESTGESMESLYQRISDGALSVDEITAAMERSTSVGGKYYQSMEKQSQTLSGRFSTLKDNFSEFAGEVTENVTPALGTVTDTLTDMMSDGTLTETLTEIFDALSQIVVEALPALVEIIQEITPALGGIVSALLPVLLETIEMLLPPLLELIEAVLPVFSEILMALLPPLTELIEAIVPVLVSLLDVLLPILTTLLDALSPLLSMFVDLLQPILDIIEQAIAPLIEIIGYLIELAVIPLQTHLSLLMGVFDAVFGAISALVINAVDTWMGVLKGLIEFIAGVFTGDWSRAWNGVVQIFSSIFNGIANLAKIPINAIIDVINGFLSGLNSIKIPSWVPIVGGQTFSMPKIPRLKRGLPYVPEDYFPAYLDEGERVLTKEQNAMLNSIGGFSAVREAAQNVQASATSARGAGGVIRIEVPVAIDGREVARATAWYMGEQLAWEERR